MLIDLTELHAYHAKFKSVFSGQQRTEILTIVGKRIGVAAESVVSDYPEPSGKKLEKFYIRTEAFGRPTRPYKSKFKSSKQAYYVVKILGEKGKIPYSRSGTLGKSITGKVVEVTPSSVVVAIGTNLKYAPYVIGDDGAQSNYHKGTWQTLSEDMKKGAAKIAKVAQSAYVAEIERRLS
jgi:hypothetical protein